jgi:hypothetical protein
MSINPREYPSILSSSHGLCMWLLVSSVLEVPSCVHSCSRLRDEGIAIAMATCNVGASVLLLPAAVFRTRVGWRKCCRMLSCWGGMRECVPSGVSSSSNCFLMLAERGYMPQCTTSTEKNAHVSRIMATNLLTMIPSHFSSSSW